MLLPQIVLFGDSNTQFGFQADKKGWGTCLADRYARKADVVLRGYFGYNTRWALELLDKIFPIPSSSPPLLVTVFLGSNDAVDPSGKVPVTQRAHVPLPEYNKNLRQIIAHLKRHSDQTHVVLIAPPPVSEKKLVITQQVIGDNSGISIVKNAHAKLYAEECMKVGQEEGLPVINLWSILSEDSDWEEKHLSDGIHLSAEGNSKLFEELIKVLDKMPTLNPGEMGLDFPDFLGLGEDPVHTLRKWCADT